MMGGNRRAWRRVQWWCRQGLIALVLIGSGVVPLTAPRPTEATTPVVAIGIGTNGIDRGFGIGVDDDGNIYATGSYGTTADFDPGPGVTAFTAVGSDDVWVAKYTPAGALVWAKSFGAGSVDNPTGFAVDATGVYVTGFFSGTVNFGLGNLAAAGNSDAFAIKLSLTDGSTIWQQRFGNPQLDRAQGLALSGTGLYIIGRFQGTTNFGGGNLTSAGGDDIFVLRLNTSDGTHVWSTRFGAAGTDPGDDLGLGIATDGTGVYITGIIVEAVNFGGATLAPLGNEDIFVARLSAANGSHLWSKRFGAAQNDRGSAVAVDATGVYVTGRFRKTVNFGGGALSSGGTDSGNEDVFAVKLALANGNHIWSKRFGDTSNDRGDAIALNGTRAFLTGRFQGTVDFGTSLTSAGTPTPSGDAFVVSVNTNDGTPTFAYRLGGTAQDEAFAIAAGGTKVYTAGEFAETADFGVGAATLNLTSGGSQDAFISVVDLANAAPQIIAPAAVNVIPGGAYPFGTTAANSIEIVDADAGSQPLRVQLTGSNGLLSLASKTGLTFTVGDGTNDATMTFTGSQTDVNLGLHGMTYQLNPGFTGTASVTVVVNDQGATGIDGAKSATKVVPVNVNVEAVTPCSPRPVVRLETVQTGPGQLLTTIFATTKPGAAANTLQQLQFRQAENALVDVLAIPGAPVGSAGSVNVSLPADTTSVQIVVRRRAPGAFRLPFTVVDACGAWPTFVGGGTGVN